MASMGIVGILPKSLYVKAFAGIFGVYGAQMLLKPSSMITDHCALHLCCPHSVLSASVYQHPYPFLQRAYVRARS